MIPAVVDHLTARGFPFDPDQLPRVAVVDAGTASEHQSDTDIRGSDCVDLGIVQVSVFAGDGTSCRALGRSVRFALDGAALIPESGGTLLDLQYLRSAWQEQEPAPDSEPPVYQRVIEFTYRIQR